MRILRANHNEPYDVYGVKAELISGIYNMLGLPHYIIQDKECIMMGFAFGAPIGQHILGIPTLLWKGILFDIRHFITKIIGIPRCHFDSKEV